MTAAIRTVWAMGLVLATAITAPGGMPVAGQPAPFGTFPTFTSFIDTLINGAPPPQPQKPLMPPPLGIGLVAGALVFLAEAAFDLSSMIGLRREIVGRLDPVYVYVLVTVAASEIASGALVLRAQFESGGLGEKM